MDLIKKVSQVWSWLETHEKEELDVLLGRDLQKTNVVHRSLQEVQAICNLSRKKVMVEIK